MGAIDIRLWFYTDIMNKAIDRKRLPFVNCHENIYNPFLSLNTPVTTPLVFWKNKIVLAGEKCGQVQEPKRTTNRIIMRIEESPPSLKK